MTKSINVSLGYSLQITDKGPICSARDSELGTIGSPLTLKDHLVLHVS